MTDNAIQVVKLSKKYMISGSHNRYSTLRETLVNTSISSINNLKNIFSRGSSNDKNGNNFIWALDKVCFDVKQGEVIGVIGRNGSGKSTLLKIISRITEPTSGIVDIYGRIGSLLEVGTGFHPELSGRENIYLNGAILGMKRIEIDKKFDEIVDFAEVEKFIDTPVKHYSSGMYLRLAFAVAAHLETEILLVDEVLAVGDAAFQKKCTGKMKDISSEGRTILFVSHNMAAISEITSRALWLDSGSLLMDTDTDHVITSYLNSTLYDTDDAGYRELANLMDENASPIGTNFSYIRIADENNKQSNVFVERNLISIELGIKVGMPIQSIQFGCGITRIDHDVELFTIPSAERFNMFDPGEYNVKVQISPNYLREGLYAINLKLFVNGLRQVRLRDVIRFSVIRDSTRSDEDGYYHKWVNGPLQFDYEWGELKPQ